MEVVVEYDRERRDGMNEQALTPEERAQELKRLVEQLQAEGRKDLLLHAIGVPLLEELRIEAAKGKLSRLVITKDYRFILEDYHREVELQRVQTAGRLSGGADALLYGDGEADGQGEDRRGRGPFDQPAG